MTDGDGLLRAVLAFPEEDTPRLVYADWLEEIGRPDHAEFVRVQVEIERTGSRKSAGCRKLPGNTCSGYNGAARLDPAHEPVWCSHCLPAAGLLEREQELFLRPDSRVLAPLGGGGNWLVSLPSPDAVTFGEWERQAVVRRGFVEEVRLTAADWLRHADAVTANHPVRRVRLTTPVRASANVSESFATDTVALYTSWESSDAAPRVVRRLSGRAAISQLYSLAPGDRAAAMLRVAWPGIAFELAPDPLSSVR